MRTDKIRIGVLLTAIMLIGVVFVASASVDDSMESELESEFLEYLNQKRG